MLVDDDEDEEEEEKKMIMMKQQNINLKHQHHLQDSLSLSLPHTHTKHTNQRKHRLHKENYTYVILYIVCCSRGVVKLLVSKATKLKRGENTHTDIMLW